MCYSNGQLDPWRPTSVLKSFPQRNIYAIIIPNAAHHLDLRASHPADPDDLTAARIAELTIIKRWIEEYWAAKNGGWVYVNFTKLVKTVLMFFS